MGVILYKRILLVFLFFFLLAASNKTIKLKTKVEIEDEIIRLKDVIESHNISEEYFSQIKNIPLRKFRSGEKFCNISTTVLSLKLKSLNQDFVIKGSICSVYRKIDYIDSQEIQNKTKSVLTKFLKTKSEKIKFSLINLPNIKKPTHNYQLKIKVIRDMKRTGLIYLEAKINSQKKMVAKFNFMVSIEIQKEVFVLNKPKRKNQIISFTDFDKKKLFVKNRDKLIKNAKELQNVYATKFCSEGTILSSKDIKKIPEVEVGDKVNVKVISGTISLYYEAISRQKGYIGEFVKCRNPESKSNFYAEVTGKNKVMINLEAK